MTTLPRPTSSEGLWDSGLQPERTRLAWRRTTLAIAVGALVALRVAPQVLGVAGLVAAASLAAFHAVVLVTAHRRSRATERALRSGGPLPGALPLLAVAVSVAALGAVAAAGVVALRLG